MALLSLLCQEQDPFSDHPTAAALLAEPYSADVIASLAAAEQKPFPDPNPTYLRSARAAAVGWVSAAGSRLGFGAPTVLLAASYLDRCFLSPPSPLLLQDDKPWMEQLSAVACLSLAAKLEETRVPSPVDLQLAPRAAAADSARRYLFEPKTVKRMELLVLSTLGWKMGPATAASFVHCFVSRLGSGRDAVGTLRKCEAALLSAVADRRWIRFRPSVWASAALLQANVAVFDELRQLMETLQISEERVEECRAVLVEVTRNGAGGGNNKRKSCSCNDPPSPNGVIGSCFSYESSCSSSLSSSPEPPPAKRAHFG